MTRDLTHPTRFVAALTKMAAVFRVEPDDVLIEAYWEALNGWPIEALESGAQAIIAGSRFFPRPVEWADAAEDWLKERQVTERSRRLALAAATEVPLKADEVKALVGDLREKLGWTPKELTAEEFEARRRDALKQAAALMEQEREAPPRA